MDQFANQSSFGARAISGAYLLLLCHSHIVASPKAHVVGHRQR
jgi:hypothetical protein